MRTLFVCGLAALALAGCRETSAAERRATSEARSAGAALRDAQAQRLEAERAYYKTMTLVRVCAGGASTAYVHQAVDGRLWLSPYMNASSPDNFYPIAAAVRIGEVC
ncbi:hypothetical protein MARCHEWKA_04640 [Brevundimonas phage vB_BpoS-Marchewka]|uniref:Lipoprotein n=1 Tax=Brevundimonas phage vB_BpoS-Marchewka TaxID=2948604 RepID=A0A9E7N331_9CAUD|nr:hypothetical protein MARCHEWKA_04640 [Brevundimonas phage vB_BpoS-Marchewka]